MAGVEGREETTLSEMTPICEGVAENEIKKRFDWQIYYQRWELLPAETQGPWLRSTPRPVLPRTLLFPPRPVLPHTLLFLPSCPGRVLVSELGWSLQGALGAQAAIGLLACANASLEMLVFLRWGCVAKLQLSRHFYQRLPRGNESSCFSVLLPGIFLLGWFPNSLIHINSVLSSPMTWSHAMSWDGIGSYFGRCFE